MAVEVARVHGLICSNMRDDSGSEDGAAARRDPNFCYNFRFESSSRQAGSPACSPCSTESESDEDSDYIAGLAQQIARSMLEDDDGIDTGSTKNSAGCGGAETEWLKVSPSPPKSSWSSTTWSLSSWASGSAPSSKVSSQGSSEVSSPPSTPSDAQTDAWDLLYAAAGEVVRLKKSEDRKSSFLGTASNSQQQQQQPPPPPQQPFHGNAGNAGNSRQHGRHVHRRAQPPHLQLQQTAMSGLSRHPSQNHNTNLSSKEGPVSGKEKPYLQRSWSANGRDDDGKLGANQAQYRMVKQGAASAWQHGRSHQAQNHHGGKGSYKGGSNRVSRSADATTTQWSGSHVNGGSGMRAVFLSSTGTGRESGGTGVFLPRSTGNGQDYRRKPACSTVLLPSRVVQVLNLNVEDMCSLPSLPAQYSIIRDSTSSAPATPSGSSILGSSAAGTDSLRRVAWSQAVFPNQLQQSGAELSLPSEWTY